MGESNLSNGMPFCMLIILGNNARTLDLICVEKVAGAFQKLS